MKFPGCGGAQLPGVVVMEVCNGPGKASGKLLCALIADAEFQDVEKDDEK